MIVPSLEEEIRLSWQSFGPFTSIISAPRKRVMVIRGYGLEYLKVDKFISCLCIF